MVGREARAKWSFEEDLSRWNWKELGKRKRGNARRLVCSAGQTIGASKQVAINLTLHHGVRSREGEQWGDEEERMRPRDKAP